MTYSRNLSLTLAAALALGAAACSEEQPVADRAEEVAQPDLTAPVVTDAGASADAAADPTGAAFLTDAMKGNNSEILLGELAASKGNSKAVKDFGKMLADEHRKAGQDVAKLATSLNVPATAATKPEADAELAKLKGLTGAEFDKEFAAFMVDDHKKDIAKYEQVANGNGPAEVKALAAATLPTLTKHLEAAEALR